MASEGAKIVAREVIAKVRKGEKPHLGKIIKKAGYSTSVSERPTKVTKTKSYLEVTEPIVEAMIKQRDRMVAEIAGREFTTEKLRDLTDAIDKLTKNAQLLGGKDTSKEAVTFTWEE